jgi:hypothetical protein
MRMAVPTRASSASRRSTRTSTLPANVAIKMDDGDNNRAKQMLAYPCSSTRAGSARSRRW